MLILGIETSCDDTAVAVVRDGHEILSNCISSQDEFHKAFSGVVPEIASRRHLEVIHLLIDKALRDSGVSPGQIDRIAVSNRPGLIGSLLVGVAAAKACALAWRKPLVPVNHLAAHLYAATFTEPMPYPHIGLVISGGHTLLVEAQSPLDVIIHGSTIDDAVGEVYDKIAKHFGLGYPGGPVLDRLAAGGDPGSWNFPRSLLDPVTQRYHFSFSGIKSAVIHQRERFASHPPEAVHQKTDHEEVKNTSGALAAHERIEDIAAAFQAAVADILITKTARLVVDLGLQTVAVTGGVAANGYLRQRFADEAGFHAVFPPRPLCTDNAVMVAGAAWHDSDPLEGEAILRLDALSRVVLRGKRRQTVSGSSLS